MIDLPQEFERVIADIPAKVPRLQHVRPENILVMVQRMGFRKQGQNAGLRHARNGRVFTPQFPNVSYEGREIHYAISFNPLICMNEFTDCPNPLEVVMHELWHIGTKGGGKLRRMKHGKKFNEIVHDLVETYERNSGISLPVVQKSEKISLRYWKRRKAPSIAYVRNGLLGKLSKELGRIDWKGEWSEKDVMQKTCIAEKCWPTMHAYECPNGHKITSRKRFVKPRSCASCSPTFNSAFLLKELTNVA